MTLIRYNPWNLFDQLHRELNQVYGYPVKTSDEENVVTSDWMPAVDIKEEEGRYLIVADIPGVDPKDIEIHMENGVLTLKGERESEKKTEREGFKRLEREHGVFYRRFSLPEGVDADSIQANSKNGVLTLVIPKQEKGQPRRITVS